MVTKGSGEEGKWWGREVVKGSDDEREWWGREVVRKGSGEEGKWWRREVVTKGSGEEGKWWKRGKWWRREVVTKGSGEEGKWWRREVVRKGSGDQGKWWRREVVKKGSDDEGERWRREVVRKGSGGEGKWWRREVVKKGSGEEGEWWRREVVKQGSDDEGEWWRREVVSWEVMMKGRGDEGKWWGREVVEKGSGDEGKWWRREVVKKGSGDEGKWWNREVMMKGSGDEGKWWVGEEAGARNLVFFRVKWLQPAMKGTSCVRRVRLGSFGFPSMCFATIVVPVCVVLCVSWSCGRRSHWNGCMNVACRVLWGGSRSTKPCVFPCKVAAAGDERYLVCAAGVAGVVWFLLCVLQQWLFLCAEFYAFLQAVVADPIGIAAWMLHAVCCGEEAGARNLVFFRESGCSRRWKVPRVCGGCGWGRLVPSMCFATIVVPVCVVICVSWSCGCRSHWNGCMNVACRVLWGGSRSTKPCVFPCKVAAAGDERYLVCAAGAAGVVWFLLCVLQLLFLCA